MLWGRRREKVASKHNAQCTTLVEETDEERMWWKAQLGVRKKVR